MRKVSSLLKPNFFLYSLIFKNKNDTICHQVSPEGIWALSALALHRPTAHGAHKPQPWHCASTPLYCAVEAMPSPLNRMKLTGRKLYLRLLLATMTADVFVNMLHGKTD
ncbi:hypothetical protein CHARACLAT_029033 [Characodon lateralis]|uniref:Uncharacterized protein n=1 Tax=Characodon lateralis TaxID=208331 RepID=A0ABU7EDR2_9TELE|nr:hypothetical protein [Characodon lateralis]